LRFPRRTDRCGPDGFRRDRHPHGLRPARRERSRSRPLAPAGRRRAGGGAPAHRAAGRRFAARPARPGRGDRRGRPRPAAHRLRGLRDRPPAALPRLVRPVAAGGTAPAPVPLLRRQGPHRLRRGLVADRLGRAAGNGDRRLPGHQPDLEARARAAAGHAGRRPGGSAQRPSAADRERARPRGRRPRRPGSVAGERPRPRPSAPRPAARDAAGI
ncbi:MAG: hypothetical protein AVDCRST_MAG04-1013, partial [uncultured Acetobacteraceae bacterium]